MVKIKATETAPGDAPVRPVDAEKFASMIEAYKKQNPVKYELKKAELERKLAMLEDKK